MKRMAGFAVAAIALVAVGASGMYFYWRRFASPSGAVPVAAAPVQPTSPDGVALTLSPEAVTRAGIQLAPVRLGSSIRTITLPGVVEPNGYTHVVVRAPTAGQLQSVPAELGAHVRAGETLATIHSPDLAEAQRVYISMRAELEAAHRRLARLEGLVKIGAASREEVEAAQVEHTTHATDVEGARARLLLLGVSADAVNTLVDASRIDPMLIVTAPKAGVITKRAFNTGQRIDASAELFTIVDLSTVWVVGDVYERDLGRVRVGTAVAMSSPALPGETWKGVVTYIDPQLVPETRTARLRVETPNPRERLRLGMYIEMAVADAAGTPVLLMPTAAVQTIGNQTVVYVADPNQNGRFFERAVRLGPSAGQEVEVSSGVAATDRVVTTGSFALRAERDRLGLPPPR